MKTYVDMDGVLADFFDRAARMNRDRCVTWRDMENRDINKALDKIRKTPDFFLTLEPFAMANTLIKSVVNIAGGYTILSSPLSGYVNCADEKIEWISRNIHIDPDDIIITDDKPVYADGNVLIDDYGYNVRKWEKAGGYGIKYQADEQSIVDVIVPLTALYRNQK